MKKTILAGAAVALLAFAWAPAAQASGVDPDWEGFFVRLDAATVTPGNANTPVAATAGDAWTLADEDTTVDWVEWGSDLTWGIGFGYSFGEKGQVSVNFWRYSEKDTTAGSSPGLPFYTFWLIGPQQHQYDSGIYPQTWDFGADLEARIIDLSYQRGHQAGDNFLVDWGLGLRFTHFEEDIIGEYAVDNGTMNLFPTSRHIESSGWGLKTSFGTSYQFTRRVGLHSDLAFSFINTSVEGDQEITDVEGLFGPPGAVQREETELKDQVGTIIDFSAGVTIRAGEHVDIGVGWFWSQWRDLVSNPLTQKSGIFGTVDPPDDERDNITWTGPRLDIKIKFGNTGGG